MIIGIDASRAFRSVRTGTERYSLEIIRHLLRLPVAHEHQWRLYVQPAADVAILHSLLDQCQAEVDVRPLAARRGWTHRSLAREVVSHPPDVLFVPAHVIPLRLPRKTLPPSVVTIHDLGYRRWPETHTWQQRVYLELSTRWSVSTATRLICVSQSTAHDVRTSYGREAHHGATDKVRVVLEGFNRLPLGELSQTERDRYGMNRPYACYVGTIQPRKNIARMIAAYASLIAQHRCTFDLVLAGQPGWHSDSLYDLARQLKCADRVHFIGYVPDQEIGTLLSEALFFCFPSLYEGFGLPVLEAQFAGVPVMTANNSSLPEIAGDAALLVDPTDVDAIAEAMLQLSQDDGLRQQLIAAGHKNVERFSWEKAADETLAVLKEAANQGKHRE